MPRFLLILLMGALLSHALPGRATHIVGGEMALTHLRDSTYSLNLLLYFDALNGREGALDDDLTAAIYEKGTNRFIRVINMPLVTNTLVDYTDPLCSNAKLVTRRLAYQRDMVLGASYRHQAGYYAVVERCCRNNSIANIERPEAAGQAFLLEFAAVVQADGRPFINSSPSLFPPLSDYACQNELFYYDFGGQDPDGDELRYELVTPLNGHSTSRNTKPDPPQPSPYSEVKWKPGLSTLNQIPGKPTLSIDPLSGRLQVQPTNLGLFVFGIKCSEYRNGRKIGEVRRDFQLLVIGCARNQKPQLQVVTQGQAQPHVPTTTLHFGPGEPRCFQLQFTDPDAASRLRLSLRALNFSGPLPTPSLTTGTVGGASQTLTSTVCFPTCLDTEGKVYQLEFIVADNGCSLPKRDTVRVNFSATAPPVQPIALRTTAALPLVVRPGDMVDFDVLGTGTVGSNLTLSVRGLGFDAAGLGATLVTTAAPGAVNGKFGWQVPCAAIDRGLHEFEFLLSSGSECEEVRTQRVVVPITVDYRNLPPELTTTFAGASSGGPPVVIRVPFGQIYEATLAGTDADPNPLSMVAAGSHSDLASMGMQFTPQDGLGKASGTFRWEAACAALAQQPLEVTFTLQEATCRPIPQQQTIRFEVLLPEVPAFLPPNIFTPNHDGKNSHFALASMLPPDICTDVFGDIQVFNRWGRQVYRSTNRNFSWDGSDLPEGVYYYLIKYTGGRNFKGTITLVR